VAGEGLPGGQALNADPRLVNTTARDLIDVDRVGRSTRSIRPPLSDLFGDTVKGIAIPEEVAEWIAKALRDSQRDKERFHRTAVLKLHQRYTAVQQKLDAAYEDRLSGRISEDFWARKSAVWDRELEEVRTDLSRQESASRHYSDSGSRILELAKNAHKAFVSQNSNEQRRLLETLLSNCLYETGSLTPTYRKPFDLLARGNEDWLGGRDSNPDNVVQSHVSYR
jgi:hypothetical protein